MQVAVNPGRSTPQGPFQSVEWKVVQQSLHTPRCFSTPILGPRRTCIPPPVKISLNGSSSTPPGAERAEESSKTTPRISGQLALPRVDGWIVTSSFPRRRFPPETKAERIGNTRGKNKNTTKGPSSLAIGVVRSTLILPKMGFKVSLTALQ